ncbi:hypothetical protein JCM11641_002909 [Rhodosporidiobolus odoratus]
MLPWTPPSSFSLSSDPPLQPQQQQQPPRYSPYLSDSNQQQQQPNQQQQQQHQQQQQNQQQGGPPQPASAAPYPPMTLAATLHFLQSEHRRYARDRNEWEIERAEMRARIALLEGEKRGSEGALKSLGRRCKMLEMALRGERSKFLSTTNALGTTNALPSAAGSGAASPIPGILTSSSGNNNNNKEATLGLSGIPPAKLAALQKDTAAAAPSPSPGTPSEAPPSAQPKSAAMAPSTSSPGQPAPAPAAAAAPSAPSKTDTLNLPGGLGLNGYQTGTWSGTLGAAAAAAGLRDPRGKARSREYLKQCLQEITYLTSSATLNPLSTHSYAAPSVPRPRKNLPDGVPPPPGATGGSSIPGVLNLAPPPPPPATSTVPAGSAQTGELQPFAGQAEESSLAPPPPSSSSSSLPTLPLLVEPDSESESASHHPHSQMVAEEHDQDADEKNKRQDLLTSFPSDPPSAFVPLKRTISQPGQAQGQPGGGGGRKMPLGSASSPSPPSDHEVKEDVEELQVKDASAQDEKEKETEKEQEGKELDREIEELSKPEGAAEGEEKQETQEQEKKEVEAPESIAAEVEKEVATEGGKDESVELTEEDVAAKEPIADSSFSSSSSSDSDNDDVPAPSESSLSAAAATPEVNDAKSTDKDVKVVEEASNEPQQLEDEADNSAFEPVAESSLGRREQAGQDATEEEAAQEQKEEESLFPVAPRLPLSLSTKSFSRKGGAKLAAALSSAGGDGGKFGGGGEEEGGNGGLSGAEASAGSGGGGEVVTALFCPAPGSEEGAEEWRRKLREAGRRAYPTSSFGELGGDEELEGLKWDLNEVEDDEEEVSGKKEARKERMEASEDTVGLREDERFKPRRVLKSHLEAVRAVLTFEENGAASVVSAGDDYVVKLWRGAIGKGGARSDLEPTITFRGHTGPITALAISSASADTRIILSASLDSTIRLWRCPPPSHSIYDPFDSSLLLGSIATKGDGAWGLAVLEGGDKVACITADGFIQVWSIVRLLGSDREEPELLRKWTYGAPDPAPSASRSSGGNGSGRKRPASLPTPTALTAFKDDLDGMGEKEYLVVAFQNAVVKVFGAGTGEEVKRMDAGETSDGTSDTQINAVAVLPSLGVVATAHEDRFIRVFDYKTGIRVISSTAHLDGVTSLAFSPSPILSSSASALLVSASHDASIRFWSLILPTSASAPGVPEASLTCVQETSTHRVKGSEGALDVAFVQGGSAVVTAGADGTVRVWEK